MIQQPWIRVDRPPNQDRPTTSTPLEVVLQPNTNLWGDAATALRGATSIADVFGCAALHPQRFGQWHSPHGLLAKKSQSTSDTTIHSSEHMFPLGKVGRIPPVGVSGRSSRKLVPALSATGLQNCSSRTGLHTMAKAVLLGAATVIWLESAFHARLLGSVPRWSRQLWTNNLLG